LSRRLRIVVEYDGTDFAGWQRQIDQRTVQATLEDAIRDMTGETVFVRAAGRTDAGVHAAGQVAHADLPPSADPAELVRRLARLLPPDVRVTAVEPAPPGFDARFSALWRRYAYRVADDPAAADPLRRYDTLAWPRPLERDAMQAAADRLLGEHDFAAFCKRRDGATTVRSLQQLDWARDPAGVLTATVRADAFCHSMVRSLVGALLAVGDGRRPPDWPAAQLARTDRSGEVTVAPAHGLTLVEVAYPPAAELAARAETTRNRREPAPG